MWKWLTLKNVTIISLLLIFIGLSPRFSPSYLPDVLFYYILGIGCCGFVLAYFIYAVNHWGIQNKVLAIVMLTIPILVLVFSNIKIPEMDYILMFVIPPVVITIAISVILLFVGTKIKWYIRPYLVKFKKGNLRFSLPHNSYAFLGLLFISFLIISSSTSSAFSDNMNIVKRSIIPITQDTPEIPVPQASYISNNLTVQNVTGITSPSQTSETQIFPDSQPFETGPTPRSFKYILRGNSSIINANLYSGIYNKVSSISQPVACYRYPNDTSPCNNEEIRQYYLNYLEEPIERKSVDDFVDLIKVETSNQDDQARIAISIVQNIPYDHSVATPLFFQTGFTRYPFLVLYQNAGICEEKSLLLAYLLRELGYGVVLFEFKSDNHMAVGIKSPVQYSYLNSGYAFIETTTPSIPTDSQGDYGTAGKLTSIPEIIPISDGDSFTSISEEYQDALLLNQIRDMGTVLDDDHYSQWTFLEKKYGFN
jgi:hypothetical protein